MRRIKFRGKRKDNGEWIVGYLVNCIPNVRVHPDKLYIVNDSFEWAEVLPETVEQFTGLTDKNGKEMYEGDVMSNGTSAYIIEYRNGAFRLIRHNMSCYVISDVDISEFEIIGNIHDSSYTNPEG